jgi:cation diffusion facilitator family transporter
MHHANAFKIERRAAIISLVTSAVLLAVKFVAYSLTGSTAIFSDALESIVNIMAAAFALYAVILAHAPADEEHPYGHGKIEFVSAGFEGGMILAAAIMIVARSVEQLVRGPDIQQLRIGAALLVAAVLVNTLVGTYLLRRSRRHGSITLHASGKHLLADAITSVGVLVALALYAATTWRWIDPVAAMIVAAYIALQGGTLLRRSAAGLMDEQDAQDDRLIRGILGSHLGLDGVEPNVCSYHKLRHRHTGRYHWVDFHVMVPADWRIEDAHNVASAIEYEIEQALGEGNATAHIEPCTGITCALCAPRSATTPAASQDV